MARIEAGTPARRSQRPRRLHGVGLACALGLAACATSRQPALLGLEYPGVLRAPETLAADVLWRQRVTAFWGEGEQRGFDAAIQRVGNELTILGLSPTGSMGFAIVLSGDTIELTNHMPEQFPFPPRNVVLDVQRTFYPWLPVLPVRSGEAGGEAQHGERQGVVDGELVEELWEHGRLMERRFTRLDGVPEGSLEILYQWGEPEWSVPTRSVLSSGWYGYRLEIETHAETLLEVRSDAP